VCWCHQNTTLEEANTLHSYLEQTNSSESTQPHQHCRGLMKLLSLPVDCSAKERPADVRRPQQLVCKHRHPHRNSSQIC
jgi:hypothetical protein